MAKESKSYRELMAELDQVMDKLQTDGLDVDEAVSLYEQGLNLTDQITNYLTASENKLTELKRQNG